MSLLPLFEWLDRTPVAATIHSKLWMFPALLTVHVLGTVLLAGTIAVLDLRLLGSGMRRQAVSDLAAQLLPWTWIGFAINAVSGVLLLSTEAVTAYGTTIFRVKMALLAIAGLNMLLFHRNVYRSVAMWDRHPVTPFQARLAGGVSITLWLAIMATGQMLPYSFY